MPGAARLWNVGIDLAFAVDGVMRRNARGRIAETRKGCVRRFHAGVMQHQHVDRAAIGARIMIG